MASTPNSDENATPPSQDLDQSQSFEDVKTGRDLNNSSAGRDSVVGDHNQIIHIYPSPSPPIKESELEAPKQKEKPNSDLWSKYDWRKISIVCLCSLAVTLVITPKGRKLLMSTQIEESCTSSVASSQSEKFKVIVSDITKGDHPFSPSLTKTLLQTIPQDTRVNNIEVCKWSGITIDNIADAKKISNDQQVIVIWLNRTSDSITIGVDVPNTELGDIDQFWKVKIPANNPDFETDILPGTIVLLLDLAISKKYELVDENIKEARKILKGAVVKAEDSNIDHQLLADAFAWLGEMYKPIQGNCVNNLECEDAIKYHSQALGLDPTLEDSLISLGQLYTKQNKVDKALECYTKLINDKISSKSVKLALLYRGYLYAKQIHTKAKAEQDFTELIRIDDVKGYLARSIVRIKFWQQYKEAIGDLEQLTKRQENAANYASLSLSQLLAGEDSAAKDSIYKAQCLLKEHNPESEQTYEEAIKILEIIAADSSSSKLLESIEYLKKELKPKSGIFGVLCKR